jgi:dsDNA-specific endonuclease/ATPase MutS2
MAVGRFQAMATLQAARAHELGLPLDSALSWGLNRAIFYAAAKRGFKGQKKGIVGAVGKTRRKEPGVYFLGDEMAYKVEKNRKLYFTIGGKVQTREDFEKQIESRFQGHFKEAWEEALKIVRQFDKQTLLSGTEFFNAVYRPRRDELADKWTELSQS